MNRYIKILIILFFVPNLLFSQSGSDCGGLVNVKWVQTDGGSEDDNISDIGTDSNGNIFITGYFSGFMNFQSHNLTTFGKKDFFLAKLDPEGKLIWIRTGGSTEDDYGTGLAVDNDDNIYVTGTYNGNSDFSGNTINSKGADDIFLIKYSSDGDYMWGVGIGNSRNDISGGVTIDSYNNPIITGAYSGVLSIANKVIFSRGDYDFLMVQYSSDGNFIWAANNGSASADYGKDILYNNLDEIFIVGEFSGTLFLGSEALVAIGNKDLFIAKYDRNGYFQWAKQIGSGSENDEIGKISTDNNGNVYVCCFNDISIDKAKVYKFSPSGTELLSFGFGGNGNVFPNAIIADDSESIYLTGRYFNGTDFGDGPTSVAGVDDYFLAKYDASGVFEYKYTAGGNGVDIGNSICSDINGSIIVGGSFQNIININNIPYQSKGNTDFMVIKYEKYFSFDDIIISSINCDPNNMCIDVSVLGGSPPLTYNWSSGGNVSKICGIPSGSYSVTVTDDSGCEIETLVNVPTLIPPTVNLPNSISICPDGSKILDAGPGFVSYKWNTNETSQSIEITNGGTYTVTVTDDNSCTASGSTVATKLPNIELFSDETITVCAKESVNFNIPGYSQYLWSDGSTNSTFSTNISGKYSLRVFDGACYYYDEIEILNYPVTPLDLTGNDFICEGGNTIISAGPGFVSYIWNDNSTNNFLWVDKEGTISVTVTDTYGCSASEDMDIRIIKNPNIDLGKDTAYCTDGSIRLSTENNSEYIYLWNTGSENYFTNINSSGEYWVKVTNKEGCFSYDTVMVTIYPLPNIGLGYNVEYCQGESELIEIPDIYASYKWSNGSTNNFITVTGTQKYYVTVTDFNGCSNTDSISGIEHLVNYPFLGNDTTLCDGIIYRLDPDHDYSGYKWSNGSNQPYLDVYQAGRYGLTVTDDIGCSNYSHINISYSLSPEIINANTGVGRITIDASGGTPPYTYSLDGETWQTSNIFENYPADYYTIYVMDENHCMDQRQVYLEEIIKIPSFFTPNGDGYNDYWEVEGLFNYPKAIVTIFDRYGKLLIEFNSGENWDGTYNGNPLPSDTYWYVIDLGNKMPVRKGNVTIKR